jgi:beta-carotene 3-hydroxylase
MRFSNPYLQRIIKAHHIHHATRTKDGAVSFGFVYAPPLDKLKAAAKRT